MPAQSRLRLGRHYPPGQTYLLTTNCHQRTPRLATPAAARVAMDALRWLDSHGKAELIAMVVMPDHVHFVASLTGTSLDRLMHSFKSFTSQRITPMLGRDTPLWQPGYHDHVLRAEEDLHAVVDYCLHNPVRAGLAQDFRQYPHLWCRYPTP